VTNGAWEMQLPQERDEEVYPVELWYRTSFEAEAIPPDARLLIDGFSGKEFKLFLNGNEIKNRGIRSRLDAEIKEIDIQKYLLHGRNIVAVKLIAQRRTDGILDLLKITGSFSLNEKKDDYIIAPLRDQIKIGDWTKQGYPFYSGTGVYETEVNIPEKYLDGKLFLNAVCGEDILEVIINDNEGKVILWHPYSLDITNLVKQGKNSFKLKVTNTLINILEGVKKESGLFIRPKIEHKNIYHFDL